MLEGDGDVETVKIIVQNPCSQVVDGWKLEERIGTLGVSLGKIDLGEGMLERLADETEMKHWEWR